MTNTHSLTSDEKSGGVGASCCGRRYRLRPTNADEMWAEGRTTEASAVGRVSLWRRRSRRKWIRRPIQTADGKAALAIDSGVGRRAPDADEPTSDGSSHPLDFKK